VKLGTEDKKKVYALVGLGVVAAYLFYANVLSGPGNAPAEKPRPAASAPSVLAPAGSGAQPPSPNLRRATPGRKNDGGEFHPTLRSKRPEDRIDPATIDPTLRLDLLAKVQGLDTSGGGTRNIFQFGQPPPLEATAVASLGKEPIVRPTKIYGPVPPPPKAEPVKEVKAPPPPINLKYYGYSSVRDGSRKTAFFLDGEEILVAAEGQTVKKRYRVVRIGVNSVVMEDTESKSQQSLPLQEDLPGTGS
jgi:hypothetical protein